MQESLALQELGSNQASNVVTANGILFKVTVSLSFAGILFVFITTATFKTYRRPLGLMVLMISIADLLFTCPTSMFFPEKTDTLCKVAATISEYGIISSFLWVGCFAHALKGILHDANEAVLQKTFRWYVAISQIVPIPFSAFVYFTNFFIVASKSKSSFCHHPVPQKGTFDYTFVISLPIPALLTAIYIAYCYCKVGNAMKGLFRSKSKFFTLMLFPIILVVSWTPILIYQVIIFFNMSLISETASRITFNLVMLQGFFNAIAYGISHRLITRVKESNCCGLFSKLRSRAQTKTEDEGLFRPSAKTELKEEILREQRSGTEATRLGSVQTEFKVW